MERLDVLRKDILQYEEELRDLEQEKLQIQWNFEDELSALRSNRAQIDMVLDRAYQATLAELRSLGNDDLGEELQEASRIAEKYHAIKDEVFNSKYRELSNKEEDALQENHTQRRLKESQIEELYYERCRLENSR